MPARLQAFRFAFLPTFFMILVLGLLAVGTWVLIFYWWNLKTTGLWIGLGGVAVVAPVLTLLAVIFFPVLVGESGLRGYDCWGLYHNVAWSEITAARPFNVLGMKGLRVFAGEQCRPLWVPLFLSDVGRFRTLVLQYAGTTNPLAVALRNAGGAKT